jgi:hypothetical protein
MTIATQRDHIDPGSSSDGSQPCSGFVDREVASTSSSDGGTATAGSHTLFRDFTDRADIWTLQEEVANLKDILSKHIAGRRKRPHARMTLEQLMRSPARQVQRLHS